MSAWLEKNQKPAAFVAASVLFLLLHWMKNVTTFPYDAGDYWQFSSLKVLLDFPKVIRGYFYPLLLSPARFLTDSLPGLGYTPYRVLSSLVYAYVFTELLPAFYVTVFGGRVSFGRRLIVPVLISILFPGLIVYTLSDIPALALMLGAAVCILRSTRHETRGAWQYRLLFLGGVLAYGAYNTRAIYLFPAALACVGIAGVVYRTQSVRTRALVTVAFLAGMTLASVPQMLINYKNSGVLSPAVIVTTQNKSLFVSQLLWGIGIQRYETSINETSHGPRVFYIDKAGRRLLQESNIDESSFGMSDYFLLIAEHPLDFIGLYGRHIVNGLDVRDGESYLMEDSVDRGGLAAFNFLIVFSGLMIMLIAAGAYPLDDGKRAERLFWVVIAMLPVAAVVPGAIETRYFIALHIAIYSAIAFSGDALAIFKLLRKHWLIMILAFGISISLFFSVSMETMASVQYTHAKPHLDKRQ